MDSEFTKKVHDGLYVYHKIEKENMHDYRHNGYHPVDVGDVLNDRYEMIRKLGHGPSATVWLGKDKTNDQYFAIKIMTGKATRKAEKSSFLDRFSEKLKSSSENGAQFLVTEYDKFKIKGVNGNHLCIVEEVMGPSVAVLWSCMLDKRISDRLVPCRAPLTKQILRQVLQGLEFLHSNGIAHGNIDTSNMLLTIGGFKGVEPNILEQDMMDPDTVTENKKNQKGAPKKIVSDQPLYRLVNVDGELGVKICDTNSAFDAENPAEDSGLSAHLRPPEAIVGSGTLGKSVDIWTLGCVIFELLTGKPLFEFSRSKKKEMDDEHLIEMNSIIGPLPSQLSGKWKPTNAFSKYVGANGQITPPPDLKNTLLLEAKFDQLRPDVIDDDEAKQIKVLMRNMLQYDPSKRPSATELLSDSWIQSV